MRINVSKTNCERRNSRHRRQRRCATYWLRRKGSWSQWCRTWRLDWRSKRSSTNCCRLRKTNCKMPSRDWKTSECCSNSAFIPRPSLPQVFDLLHLLPCTLTHTFQPPSPPVINPSSPSTHCPLHHPPSSPSLSLPLLSFSLLHFINTFYSAHTLHPTPLLNPHSPSTHCPYVSPSVSLRLHPPPLIFPPTLYKYLLLGTHSPPPFSTLTHPPLITHMYHPPSPSPSSHYPSHTHPPPSTLHPPQT